MKKFLFFVISVFMLCFFVACSNEDECGYSEKISCSLNNENYDLLKKKVDSISNYYLQNSGSIQTRKNILEYVRDKKIQNLADNAGRVVGGYIGKNVGVVIGSAGTPLGGIMGYVVGKGLGQFFGSITASFVAYRIIEKYFSYRANLPSRDSSVFYYLPDSCYENNDSIGYYHNLVMYELVKNGDKYDLDDGNFNYNMIYDDCLSYLLQYGAFDNCKKDFFIACRADFKYDIISYVKITSGLSDDFIRGKIDELTYQSRFIESIDDYNLTDEERLAFCDYAMQLSEICSQLSYEANIQYAEDLNHEISHSNISDELKNELRSTTNMIVNSSIFYDMVK